MTVRLMAYLFHGRVYTRLRPIEVDPIVRLFKKMTLAWVMQPKVEHRQLLLQGSSATSPGPGLRFGGGSTTLICWRLERRAGGGGQLRLSGRRMAGSRSKTPSRVSRP